MTTIAERFERSRSLSALACLVLVVGVGVVDYLTGYDILFSAFYLIPVGLAAWFIGGAFAVAVSILSVAAWLTGDRAAGARYSNWLVPAWNGLIALVIYFVIGRTLVSLRELKRELEERVRQRTEALTAEIAERGRLEREILEISEREQRRIGHDLHDGLCQHWAATAMAGQVLAEKLAEKTPAEAADARAIVRLAEDGMTLTRDLARGISPVDMKTEGLAIALRQLAANTSRMFGVTCRFEGDPPVGIGDAATETQLYRIGQEAVSNALRHGKPRQIVLSLSPRKGRGELTIEDDGAGLLDDWQKGVGLGTRIMTHRAMMIGGHLSIEPNPTGGTFVRCSFPLPAQAPDRA